MPLAWIAVYLSAGIWISSIIRVPVLFSAVLAVFSLAISATFIKKAKFSFLALSAAFFFIGCMLFGASQALPAGHIRDFTPSYPEEALLEGDVADDPSVTKTFYGEPRTNFVLEARELRRGGIKARVSGKVKVSVVGRPEKVPSYGDAVTLRGKLSMPQGPGNPGEFDNAKYLARHRIFSSFSANAREMKVTAGAGKKNPVAGYAYKARERIRELISGHIPEGDSGDFLIAILLGLRQGLSDGLNDDFMKTGTVHLLA
ncbi:MAG TPA: ComEC/Rec2 family competence protein, partial [Candidatus Omnitrophota bacterium]|nr:ComEC/Rec2 family competence protein [Candidatus Omnitrophota bacterium]